MQTGDILVGRRFSGNAAEWMLLSGGFANHVAMIVEGENGKRYVIDCPTEIGAFSEVSGVAKTELNEWLNMAVQDDFEVAWLPLNKNLRSYGDFDHDKLDLWIKEHLNLPYSRVAAFFAAVDTPDESFPAPINAESIPIILRLYDQYSGRIPEVAGGKVMDQLIEALDKRAR